MSKPVQNNLTNKKAKTRLNHMTYTVVFSCSFKFSGISFDLSLLMDSTLDTGELDLSALRAPDTRKEFGDALFFLRIYLLFY